MPEGKTARGWRLTRESWSVVRGRPGLLVIPAVSTALWLVAVALLLGPWSLDVIHHHARERLFVDAAIGAYPFTFMTVYFNVAFYALAAAAFDGRPMTTAQALRHARSRVWAVAAWALVATIVGIALRSLEQLPFGGLAGRAAEWVGSIAWSLASFFVVPVLALEDVGVQAALARSVGAIRARWGESVTGAVVIGAAGGLVSVVATVAGLAGFFIGRAGFAPAYALTALAAVTIVVVAVVQAAVGQVFRLAVLRYATGEGATGPFAAADLDAAFRQRRR